MEILEAYHGETEHGDTFIRFYNDDDQWLVAYLGEQKWLSKGLDWIMLTGDPAYLDQPRFRYIHPADPEDGRPAAVIIQRMTHSPELARMLRQMDVMIRNDAFSPGKIK